MRFAKLTEAKLNAIIDRYGGPKSVRKRFYTDNIGCVFELIPAENPPYFYLRRGKWQCEITWLEDDFEKATVFDAADSR